MKNEGLYKSDIMVSIIVPTYNVEEYIDQCLKSLVEQTYSNIEIIVIIDGATDKSYDKALAWKKRDDRIKVYYQDNAGSGPARNNGLSHCSGEFIIFMDPDDWIDKDMIKNYIELQIKYDADFIGSGYYEVLNENKVEKIRPNQFPNIKYLSKDDVRKNYIKLFLMEAVSAPTRILYRRSIIINNGIEFPDLRRSQDIVFNYRYFKHINKLVLDSNIYYYYRIDSNTYLLKLSKEYYKTIIILYEEISAMVNEWGIDIQKKEWEGLNNKFLVLIGYYIESCIMRKDQFEIVFEEDCFYNIANKSRPYELYHMLIRYFILNKNKGMIYLLVRLKILTKKHLKCIFNKIKKLRKF